MAEKWHISKNGEPAKCTATVQACPLGEDAPHFASKAEAYRAIEKSHAANFVKQTGSLSKARSFQKKYGTDDPEINSIVEKAIGNGAVARLEKTGDVTRDGRIVNVKTVSMSKGTRALVDRLNGSYAEATIKRDSLGLNGHNGAEYATTMRSLENVSADADLLRARLLETTSGGANRTYGDVMYVADTHKGGYAFGRHGLLVQTAVSFDSEALAADMAAKGYDVSDVQDTHSSLSVSKLKQFANAAADAELGLSKGMKGAPALRAQYLENSGMFRTEVTYSPDKKQVDALVHANQDAVVPRRFDEETVSKMSAAQVRAALVTVGEQKSSLTTSMSIRENTMVAGGWRPADKKADGKGYSTTMRENDTNDGLTFKPRRASVLVDGADAVKWVRDRGGDPSQLMNKRTYVSSKKLAAFSKKHPEIGYYKYAKPVQRVSYTDEHEKDGKVAVFS